MWTLEELEEYANRDDNYTLALKGIVFEMGLMPRGDFKDTNNGKDVTLVWANRWAYASEENTKSVDALEDVQKEYLNAEVQSWLSGERGIQTLGKLGSEHYDWGFDNYTW